jgi:hypothetical protein
MAAINKKEFYNAATAVLDYKTFTFDDDQNKISFKLPLKWEQIVDLKKIVLTLLGNPHTPERDWEQDPAHWGYKFDSHYLEVDEDTIKINDQGRLYVDINTLTDLTPVKDKVIEKILADEETLNKIAEKILEKLTVYIPDIQQTLCCDDDDCEGFIHPPKPAPPAPQP